MDAQAKNPSGSRSERECLVDRRRDPRHPCVMEVECDGRTGPYVGRTIDVSRSGVLVEISDPTFFRGVEGTGLAAFSSRVLSEFARGIWLRFTGASLLIGARVVRVVRHPAVESLLIGCEFLIPLTKRQCLIIGLPTEESPDSKLLI